VKDELAVSRDGMRMFGIMELETQFHACRFALGLRNSHDRSMRLGLVCGYRVAVCENMMFSGEFHPVLAKHSKNFSLLNALSIGIDQMQRNFEPMKKQIEIWRESQLTDVEARILIYEAFFEGELCVPQYLGRMVHDRYFNPAQEEFSPRFGPYQTPSLPPSRSLSQCRSSSRLRDWGSFFKRFLMSAGNTLANCGGWHRPAPLFLEPTRRFTSPTQQNAQRQTVGGIYQSPPILYRLTFRFAAIFSLGARIGWLLRSSAGFRLAFDGFSAGRHGLFGFRFALGNCIGGRCRR
jgi:hypothetical protein